MFDSLVGKSPGTDRESSEVRDQEARNSSVKRSFDSLVGKSPSTDRESSEVRDQEARNSSVKRSLCRQILNAPGERPKALER
jgi:hypothetical protein